MTAESDVTVALLDVNVLIALAWPNHVHHDRARTWFERGRTGGWATCTLTELGFLRLSTNVAVTGRSIVVADALVMLSRIRTVPGHQHLPDASSLLEPVIDLTRITTSRQVSDAHLVNLCATAGVRLATMDASLTRVLSPADHDHVLLLP